MSKITDEDHRKAREWWQENAHRYAREGVSNNRSGRGGVDVGQDGFIAGCASGRADEKTAQAKCWTCGGDPHSHPSGALCICENGTHASEVVHLRMLAQAPAQADDERCSACHHYWWRKGACTKATGDNDEDRRYWSEPSHRPRWCPGFEFDPIGCDRCGRGSNEPIPPDTKCERCRCCLNDLDEPRNTGDGND